MQTHLSYRFHLAVDVPGLRRSGSSPQIINQAQDVGEQASRDCYFNVFRSANMLVKQHGAEAPIEAAMRADAMLDRADLDGQRVWLRILAAVNELLDTRSGNGAVVH